MYTTHLYCPQIWIGLSLLLFHALLYPNIWSFYCNSNDCIIVATPILWLHLALQLRKYSQLVDTECLTTVILYCAQWGQCKPRQGMHTHNWTTLMATQSRPLSLLVRFCTPYNARRKSATPSFYQISYRFGRQAREISTRPDKIKNLCQLLCFNIRTHRAFTKSSALQKLVGC